MPDSHNFTSSFSLTDEIVDIIRDRILKGEYKIGEKIKENQIALRRRFHLLCGEPQAVFRANQSGD